jgi:hypothetical protein
MARSEIGLKYGGLRSIQTFEPVTPDKTLLPWHLFLSGAVATKPTAKQAALQQFLNACGDRACSMIRAPSSPASVDSETRPPEHCEGNPRLG